MKWRSLFSLLLALGSTLFLQAQEITFQARVDRHEVSTGEPVKLIIELENASASGGIATPELGGLVVLQGPMESNSFSMINGQMTRSSTRTWYLTSPQPGTYTIGPSTVRIGNGKLETDPITIKVVKGQAGSRNAAADQAQKRDANLFCTVTLNKNQAYVGEQVIATYTLYNRYNQVHSRGSELPQLSGFWAEDVELGSISWESGLQTVNGLQYRVAILKKQVLIPLRSGKLTVPPLTLNFLVNPSFFSSGTPVRIESNATEVNVKELPPGRPADFIGAVGDLRMDLKVPETDVQANEAIDLSIRFTGRANLKLVDAPQLALPPGFEAYDPKINDRITVSSSGMSGSREFQYLLIPRNEGDYDLGSLTFSYFDPASATYKQLRADPLVFHVSPGEGGPGGASGAPVKVDVQRLGSDIRYIRTGDLQLKLKGSHLFGSWAYGLGMAVPPTLLLILFVWHRRREERLGDAVGQRRRGADRVAKQRLAKAEEALGRNDREDFYDALGKALEGYFADKFNLGVAEVNEAMIREKLGELDDGKTATEYIALMNEAQMARFAPMADKPSKQAYDEASTIISHIENKLGK